MDPDQSGFRHPTVSTLVYVLWSEPILSFSFQDSGAVRKVFSLNGKPVVAVADFTEDEVFIAYGVDKCSNNDFDLDMVEFRLAS